MTATETMQARPSKCAEFFDGVRESVPVVLATAPFGMLFGTLAVQNGFTIFEAALMSGTVYAGASQLVGLDLFGQKIAPWLIILSIFAVNFRHVLYSAALGRHVRHWKPWQRALGFFFLTDPQYAEGEKRGLTIGLSFSWFMGYALALYVFWVFEGVLGAAFGNLIPNPYALGLDFILPIYFLCMVLDFRQRPMWLPIVAASSVASIAAYYFVGAPWHVSIGAVAGILLAVCMPIVAEGAEK